MSSAEELARKYITPRAEALTTLENYVTSKQYEGKVPWFSTSSDCPVFERKPCINYPIAKIAIGSHVAFVLGEQHWPSLTCAPSENDESIEEDWGLDESDSKAFDSWVDLVLVKFARLKELCRESLGDAMAARSVAVVACVRAGKLVAETVKASWCEPELDDCGECTKLTIQYPYIEDFKNTATGFWDKRCRLYRRVIDSVSDTVYAPGVPKENGADPDWTIDKSKSRDHGLGFCPVIWYPFLKPCSVVGNIDGVAIHEEQLSEIDCLNRSLSQRHRAAVTAGDPQAYETGVGADENPGPVGRTVDANDIQTGMPRGQRASAGDIASATSASKYNSPRSNTAPARKKGAGIVWRYKNENAKVGYMIIPGDSLKAVDEDAKDLHDKIAQAMFAVFVDPASLKMHAALSGKAMAFLFSRQIGFCDQIRQDFGEKFLLPLVSMLLRMVSVVGSRNAKALRIPGLKKILPILAKFQQDAGDDSGAPTGATVWMAPRLEPVWGPYFPPNEQDQLFIVQLVGAAKTAGIVTTLQCVEKLSKEGVFDVGSPAEVVEAIQSEKDEATKAAMDTMHALGGQDGSQQAKATTNSDGNVNDGADTT